MIEKVLDYFIATQSPWAILFVMMLGYVILTNARREGERREELKDMRNTTEKELQEIKQSTLLMLETWKIVIERELQRRENK